MRLRCARARERATLSMAPAAALLATWELHAQYDALTTATTENAIVWRRTLAAAIDLLLWASGRDHRAMCAMRPTQAVGARLCVQPAQKMAYRVEDAVCVLPVDRQLRRATAASIAMERADGVVCRVLCALQVSTVPTARLNALGRPAHRAATTALAPLECPATVHARALCRRR